MATIYPYTLHVLCMAKPYYRLDQDIKHVHVNKMIMCRFTARTSCHLNDNLINAVLMTNFPHAQLAENGKICGCAITLKA